MYKIGVIGDRDSVLGFLALGFSVSEVQNAAEAGETLDRLANEEYAVILITENYARQLSDKMAEYGAKKLPSVLSIPDGSGESGKMSFGTSMLKSAVERAVGSDIVFRD